MRSLQLRKSSALCGRNEKPLKIAQGRRVSHWAKAGVRDHQSTSDLADGPQRLDGMLASDQRKGLGALPEMFEACSSSSQMGGER